ncbi:hypothetical protein GGR56DRAFT_35708 [Xylariaceae sp. FL0804]|nr:hypothetical protein GGR56DRAFT_35708 [Xylariaceae sp. FL0804]
MTNVDVCYLHACFPGYSISPATCRVMGSRGWTLGANPFLFWTTDRAGSGHRDSRATQVLPMLRVRANILRTQESSEEVPLGKYPAPYSRREKKRNNQMDSIRDKLMDHSCGFRTGYVVFGATHSGCPSSPFDRRVHACRDVADVPAVEGRSAGLERTSHAPRCLLDQPKGRSTHHRKRSCAMLCRMHVRYPRGGWGSAKNSAKDSAKDSELRRLSSTARQLAGIRNSVPFTTD